MDGSGGAKLIEGAEAVCEEMTKRGERAHWAQRRVGRGGHSNISGARLGANGAKTNPMSGSMDRVTERAPPLVPAHRMRLAHAPVGPNIDRTKTQYASMSKAQDDAT